MKLVSKLWIILMLKYNNIYVNGLNSWENDFLFFFFNFFERQNSKLYICKVYKNRKKVRLKKKYEKSLQNEWKWHKFFNIC